METIEQVHDLCSKEAIIAALQGLWSLGGLQLMQVYRLQPLLGSGYVETVSVSVPVN